MMYFRNLLILILCFTSLSCAKKVECSEKEIMAYSSAYEYITHSQNVCRFVLDTMQTRECNVNLFVSPAIIKPYYLDFTETIRDAPEAFKKSQMPNQDFNPYDYLSELLYSYETDTSMLFKSCLEKISEADKHTFTLLFSNLQNDHLFGMVIKDEGENIKRYYDYIDYRGSAVEFLFIFSNEGKIKYAFEKIVHNK